MKDPADKRRRQLYNALRNLAFVGMAFCIAVTTMLVINYIQTRQATPLTAETVETLRRQLRENPDDAALRESVTQLDQLARRAHFSSTAYARTGAWLLLVGISVLAICLKGMDTLRKQLPNPREYDKQTERPERHRLALGAIGVALLGICIALALRPPALKIEASESVRAATGVEREVPDTAPPKPVAAPVLEAGELWPAFRGPGGLGKAADLTPPLDWDAASGRNIRWRTKLELPGYNSPVIAGNRLFLSAANREREVIRCFDSNTGELLWTYDVKDVPGAPREPPEVTEDTGYSAPSMATDGRHVCAIFATGNVVCIDISGQLLWARNLGVPENHYGHSSSLLIHEELLIVQYDHSGSRQVYGLNLSDGKTAWATDREVETSWASPALIDTGVRRELILCSMPAVMAYNPDNGNKYWELECLTGEVGPSAGYASGILLVTNDSAQTTAIDVNTQEVLWQNWDDVSDVASPLAVGELGYVATSYGPLTCYNLVTGEVHWRKEFDNGFYASPVAVGEHVVFINRKGVGHIVKADTKYQCTGAGDFGETVVATPAFTPGRMYVRGTKTLFCVERKTEAAESSQP